MLPAAGRCGSARDGRGDAAAGIPADPVRGIAWARALGAQPKRRPFEQIEDAVDEEPDRKNAKTLHTARERFENTKKQLEGVRRRLASRDSVHAARYAEQLVNAQLADGGAQYAAMSLCSLAQEARKVGLVDLQLEWLQRAAQLAPNDPWVHGQTGDAYITIRRLDEADREFKLAGEAGDEQYALTGRARMYRASGRYSQALQTFTQAKEIYGRSASNARAWTGYAEVLRELFRYNEALAAYEEARAIYADDSGAWSGYAATLKDLGRLDQSYEAYSAAIERFDEPVAISGRADVLKVMGKLSQSIEEYRVAVERFPNRIVPLCGLADALNWAGEYEEALRLYTDAKEKFHYEPTAFCGYAEVLRDSGRIDEAVAAYEEAAALFKYDLRTRVGRANILRIAGRFTDALRAYDENVNEFPYDHFSQSGRAHLLKVLGKPNEALAAYDKIIEQQPDNPGARGAKAAVLALLNRFDEARALVEIDNPQTSEEWTAFHVKGIVELRSGNTIGALKIFKFGSKSNPFAKSKRWFDAALAVSQMKLGHYRDAEAAQGHLTSDVERLIKAHVYFALQKLDRADDVLKYVNDNLPDPQRELRTELLSRFKGVGPIQYTEAWLIDREMDTLLQAA